jgi:hypothetical protein
MRKPPKVSSARLQRALDGIHNRHADDDNTSTHLLSSDPREVLAYLQRRGVRELRGDANGHDVVDALTLRIWLWWEGERAEVWFMAAGVQLGLTGKTIGEPLGVTTRAGVMSRLDYKRELIADDTAGVEQAQTGRVAWLAEHRDEIVAVARTLVEHWDLVSEETAEQLVEVRHDLREGRCTPESFAYIDWAVEDVAIDPAVVELPVGNPLKRALAAWSRLLASYPPAD